MAGVGYIPVSVILADLHAVDLSKENLSDVRTKAKRTALALKYNEEQTREVILGADKALQKSLRQGSDSDTARVSVTGNTVTVLGTMNTQDLMVSGALATKDVVVSGNLTLAGNNVQAGGSTGTSAFSVTGDTADSQVSQIKLPGSVVANSTGLTMGSVGYDQYGNDLPYLSFSNNPSYGQWNYPTPAVNVQGTLFADQLQVGTSGFDSTAGYAGTTVDQYGDMYGLSYLGLTAYYYGPYGHWPRIDSSGLYNFPYGFHVGGQFDAQPRLTGNGLEYVGQVSGVSTLTFKDGSSMSSAPGNTPPPIGHYYMIHNTQIDDGVSIRAPLGQNVGVNGLVFDSSNGNQFTVLNAGMYTMTFDLARTNDYSNYGAFTWTITYRSGYGDTITSPPYQFSTGTSRYFHQNESFFITLNNATGHPLEVYAGQWGTNFLISAVYG